MKVPVVVLASFRINYPEANEIRWTGKAAEHKVEFELKQQKYLACFDKDGNALYTSRYLPVPPGGLYASIQNDFPGYQLAESFEVNNNDGTEMTATLVKDRTTLIIKSIDGIKWRVTQMSRK
jgi:hypothetical protein